MEDTYQGVYDNTLINNLYKNKKHDTYILCILGLGQHGQN